MTPALPLLGHAPWFWRDTNGFLLRLARAQGDVARFRLGRRDAFLLCHPDHVRRVLVDDAAEFRKGDLMRRARRLLGDGLLTSEGEHHRCQRRAMQPAFSRSRLAAYGAVVPYLATLATVDWSDGRPVDVGEAMDRLSLDIVVRTLLGADPSPLEADLRILSTNGPLLALPLAHQLERLHVPPFAAAGRAADRLHDAMRDHCSAAPPMNEPDQAMTVFLAGHDTTAAALTWAWYLLATHPAAAARLRRELDAVLGDRDPEPDDCPRLAYTAMILEETLRLFPPIGRIGRRPLRDCTIDGHLIPAGSAVFLSPFVTQRDARWWPDPERFVPERWTGSAAAGRPRFAAFPFGAGPRSCIGGAMARMIGVLVIATIARRWMLHPVSDPAPRIRPILTLKPAGGLRLRAVALSRFLRRHPVGAGVVPEVAHGDPESRHFPPEPARVGAEVRHVDPEVRYVDPEVRHVDPEVRHVDPEVRHVDPEVRHVDPEVRHVDPEVRHRDANERPVYPEIPPVAPIRFRGDASGRCAVPDFVRFRSG